ncbi:MAG: lipopolysaccharide biosynthesis protein [Proteobacteria bacterium]|nr:lipopolysaccharide biosynthesis protein [Pseudomonadota bacterium]
MFPIKVCAVCRAEGGSLSFLRNTSWSAAGNITNAVGRMAITVILARRLGPESFGVFVFVQWLIDTTFMVYSVGLPGVATRFFPQSTDQGGDQFPGFNRWFLRAGFLAVVLTGCFATLATLVFSDEGDIESVAAVAYWAASCSIWALLGARAQGLFQFKRYTTSMAILVAVALVGLVLPPVGGDIVGAILVMATANLAAAAYCAFDLFDGKRITHNKPLTQAHSELIRQYATNSWLTSIAASLVWARGEISLVKGHLGDLAVGYYSIGLTVSALVNQGLGLLTGALWPQIARSWDNGDRDELLKFSNLVTNLTMLIAGLSAGFVICFAPYIVALLFGEKFLPSSKLILILGTGTLGLASGCAQLVLQAATNGKFGRDVTIAGVVALFGIALILIPRYGIEGAALARSAVQIGVAVLTLAWLGKVLGHSTGTSQNLRAFLLLVMLTGSLAVCLYEPELSVWVRLVVYGAYCCLVCLICARTLRPGILSNLRKLSGGADA